MSKALLSRKYTLTLLSVVIAAVCARLGVWQLHRLGERRARNAVASARLAVPPVPVVRLPRDSGAVRYRRALVHGSYDYAHEIVLTSRTHNGSPGVDILTPARVAGSDSAVLVNRGWVYAADGVSADLTRWHEGDSVGAVGYAEPLGERRRGAPRLPGRPRAYRWVDAAVLREVMPYPVLPYVIVLQGGPQRPDTPARLAAPALDEGPHMSYAIQWFSFALIAIIGTQFFLRRTRPSTVQHG